MDLLAEARETKHPVLLILTARRVMLTQMAMASSTLRTQTGSVRNMEAVVRGAQGHVLASRQIGLSQVRAHRTLAANWARAAADAAADVLRLNSRRAALSCRLAFSYARLEIHVIAILRTL
mgnify:CR=1 FL=1